ncbi:diguanylate cyclase with PAS/PAC sensor [Pseudoxanthomonas sp. GM95]|uniref:GGDEF domain-containing protein n=1 Tax=Pseudoxanthomonas sp. GM95 TaxID=1881043 RepID=UPI0008CF04A6|nr:diguanylate cyclase [Pseudoxanthomonas sp. GM95]SEK94794.1 diguanylate cyclase with PAS/PAC sensor [Pseudoxanthomonas sp. GM95]
MAVKLPPANIVLDLLPDAVCMVDPQGHFLYVNAAFERIFGYRPQEALGRQMLDLVHPDDRALTLQVAERIMQGEPQPHFRNRYIHRDGHLLDIQWSARWLPEFGLRLAVGHEVTALRGAERALEHLASHDPLTGLANRAQLWSALETAMARVTEGEGLAVLYLDLDGFKRINDRHGHAAGDLVLQDVAQRLREAIAPHDVVARVGGDEFVVLLPHGLQHEAWRTAAQALRAAVIAVPSPLPLDVSIGMAGYPGDGETADALLRHADAEMYAQKTARRAQEASTDAMTAG